MSLTRTAWFAALALLLLAVLGFAPAEAATVPWRPRAFTIVANEKPLADFLRELLAGQGITAVIDPKVTGTISGRFGGQAKNILDSVATTYGLTCTTTAPSSTSIRRAMRAARSCRSRRATATASPRRWRG